MGTGCGTKSLSGGVINSISGGNTKVNITNCNFYKNVASQGGAIKLGSASTLNVVRSSMSNNAASLGGAIYAYNSKVSISDSNFSFNKGSSYGGALRLFSRTPADISGTTFSSNQASQGGILAISGASGNHVKLTSCTATGNTASYRGNSVVCSKTTEYCILENTTIPQSDIFNCRTSLTTTTTTTTTQGPTTSYDPTGKSCGVTAQSVSLGTKIGMMDLIKPDVRIVDGTQVTSRKHYPWMALLRRRGSFMCGASLIHRNWVLTAAHCVTSVTMSTLQVYLGDFNKNVAGDGELMFKPKNIIIHKDYYPRFPGHKNDIALIELATSAPYNDHIRTVCLPCSLANHDFTGEIFKLTGWGRVENTGALPSVLREASLPFVSNPDCKRTFRNIKDSHICAGNGKSSSCNGDSGGPLVYNKNGAAKVVGVVSYGVSGCHVSKVRLAVYTRVTSFISWIEKTTGEKFC